MRNAAPVLLMLALAFGGGCTHRQLAKNVVSQTNTIADIHYRQILDNVAASRCNADVLPHFAVAGSGGTLVIDGANANFGLDWDETTLIGQSLGVGGSRTFEDGWTLAPIVDPDKLRAMRAAFQITTRGTADPADFELLRSLVGPEYLESLRSGWYCVGDKCDVPDDACYVASCGHRYVWVTPSGLDGLSSLTLVILNVATVDVDAATAEPQKKIEKYNYKDGEIDSIETYSVPMPEAGTVTPRARENFYNPLQSQILLQGAG